MITGHCVPGITLSPGDANHTTSCFGAQTFSLQSWAACSGCEEDGFLDLVFMDARVSVVSPEVGGAAARPQR